MLAWFRTVAKVTKVRFGTEKEFMDLLVKTLQGRACGTLCAAARCSLTPLARPVELAHCGRVPAAVTKHCAASLHRVLHDTPSVGMLLRSAHLVHGLNRVRQIRELLLMRLGRAMLLNDA